MNDWRKPLQTLLSANDAPPVLTRDLLRRYSKSLNDNVFVPASSLTYWKTTMVAERKLEPVQRGLFLNRFRKKNGALPDACFWYHPDAIVSLNTVLGDSGVLNNPTAVVTAIVPIDRAANPPSRLGRRKTMAGTLHFFGMPRRFLEAGRPDDRLDAREVYEHLRATPEKALIDWLYLGTSPRSKKTLPPRTDIDIDMLNMRRLKRLGKAAEISDELNCWLDC